MDFEYHLICIDITLIFITLLIGWYSYASGSFPQCKTVYLTHIYEPKNKSAKFVERTQVYFEHNSLCTNPGLININLMIVNTDASDVTAATFLWRINSYLFNIIIIFIDVTSWQNEQNQKILIELQPCVVKTNVTGSNHFKQKIISINSFHLTFQNKHILIDWEKIDGTDGTDGLTPWYCLKLTMVRWKFPKFLFHH